LCDVVLEDAAAAAPLIRNIRRSPLAATVLVQVLRLTESLDIAQALSAESLAYSTLQAGPEFRRWLQTKQTAAPAIAGDAGPAVLMQRDGERLDLQLNRPSNRNALSVEMRDALMDALQLVLSDDSIRQVRLGGRGKCFSTGGDLGEFGTAPDPATAHAVRSLALPGRLLAACAARVEVRLHGACIGSGIEFPAFAGRIVAAGDTHFQLPELKFGLIPGAGGCISIPRRIGRQRTGWLALSGQRIKARQALQWGLVDAIDDGP
jgi:enoyl-CoA hydratase/carnithine racemase